MLLSHLAKVKCRDKAPGGLYGSKDQTRTPEIHLQMASSLSRASHPLPHPASCPRTHVTRQDHCCTHLAIGMFPLPQKPVCSERQEGRPLSRGREVFLGQGSLSPHTPEDHQGLTRNSSPASGQPRTRTLLPTGRSLLRWRWPGHGARAPG